MGAGKPNSGKIGGGKLATGNSRQKYQNKIAFKHNPGSKLTQKILNSPVTGLCSKCHELIEWRKRYRKYKPLTVTKKCVDCGEKRITEAYHVLCSECSAKEGVCAKCRQSDSEIINKVVKDAATVNKEEQDLMALVKAMPERMRRTYHRKLETGDLEAAETMLERMNVSMKNADCIDSSSFSESDDEGF